MGELQNRKKDGTQYCEKVRIAPIFSDDGTITHFISIKEDITKQKQNLNKIEDSERKLIKLNAQKDKFFSIIAHDLRSPFSGLVGLADMLHHDFKKLDQNTLENYLGLLSNSSHQVLKLVENLLAWARTQTGRIEFKPQPLNVKNYITDVFEVQSLAAKNKQINLIDKSPEDIFVKADANMLLTILRNLISNAIKYTHKSGIVSIETSIKLYNKTPFAVISISDTGVGIPLEKQDKLFKIEENYTTIGTEKEKGNGLGLILCKEFVEMHGGKIWCSSIEGSGSSFFFSLPLP
jgi:signal transduction histidine kinase